MNATQALSSLLDATNIAHEARFNLIFIKLHFLDLEK